MAKQKNPKTPVELYNLFVQGDPQLSPYLNSLTPEQDEVVLMALNSALAEPVVVFERWFAKYYVAFQLAEEGSEQEQFFYALTRMLGYEYENYYRLQAKFLMESALHAAQHDPDAVNEGRYFSPSDPAGTSPLQRKVTYSLPRWDPRGTTLDKKAPASFSHRVSSFCDSCNEVEQHDVWKVILGMNVGLRVNIGKNSTFGKAGKRTDVAICARCGCAEAQD